MSDRSDITINSHGESQPLIERLKLLTDDKSPVENKYDAYWLACEDALHEIESLKAQLEKERERARTDTALTVEEYCQKYHFQKCSDCNSSTCCDNTSPLRADRDKLKAQLDEARECLRDAIDCYMRTAWVRGDQYNRWRKAAGMEDAK